MGARERDQQNLVDGTRLTEIRWIDGLACPSPFVSASFKRCALGNSQRAVMRLVALLTRLHP